MKIKEFQEAIAIVLNADETLVQGGCKAIAEDSHNVIFEVEQQLATAQGVAIVVTTPEFRRNGCGADAIPAETSLQIRCVEMPALNRVAPGNLTALDAAERVIQVLSTVNFYFQSINQMVEDATKGIVVATVTFVATIGLKITE